VTEAVPSVTEAVGDVNAKAKAKAKRQRKNRSGAAKATKRRNREADGATLSTILQTLFSNN